MARLVAPTLEPRVPGEARGAAWRRQKRNRAARAEWLRVLEEPCARCGYARINVRHETDPATSPEGPAYYADMLDELHEFEPLT